jgi:hypothetical protein
MAEFKGFANHQVEAAEVPQVAIMGPLFDDTFDPENDGGLVSCFVDTPEGQAEMVGEVCHPSWAHDGKTEVADRTKVLPVRVCRDASGAITELVRETPEFKWLPYQPTLGGESESDGQHNLHAHRFTQDGETILLPNGRAEPFKNHPENFQPEGYKGMIEWSIDSVAHGWQDYYEKTIDAAAKKQRWLDEHGIETARPSVYPEKVSEEDFLLQSFVQCIGGPGKMRSLQEFAGMSEQHLIGMLNHQAAAHALAKYQGIQALFNLTTEAAPVRDGSFETTFFEHYHDEYVTRDGSELVLPENDFLRYLFRRSTIRSNSMRDWREASRAFGSQGAGAHSEVLPGDFTEFMRQGDQALRGDKSPITIERMLGWHADRYRLNYNALELCNLATSGGNLHKKLATDEIASKYVVAEQLYYARLEHEQPEGWREEVAKHQARAVEIGQTNNVFASVSGKDTDLLVPAIPGFLNPEEKPLASRQEIAEAMIAFTDSQLQRYGVSIDNESKVEFMATLANPPEIAQFKDATDVITYFFQPRSAMTANEALRYAHALQPKLSVRQLYSKYNAIRRQHVFAMEALVRQPEFAEA